MTATRQWMAGLGAAVCLAARAGAWEGVFDADFGDTREEPAGETFAFLVNPADGVYGLSAGFGLWVRGTPVFGDYAVHTFSSGIEEAWYVGGSLTVRVMPRCRVAPFIGLGGGYDLALTVRTGDDDELDSQGDSFFEGHAECGVRVQTGGPLGLVELKLRQVYPSLGSDHSFWLLGLGFGMGRAGGWPSAW